MDWYPLWNSLRIAAISTAAVFFLGLFAAYYIAKLPRAVKGVLDVVLTLPLVLPPTVVGWLLLVLLGPRRPVGLWVYETFGVKLVMTSVPFYLIFLPLSTNTNGLHLSLVLKVSTRMCLVSVN